MKLTTLVRRMAMGLVLVLALSLSACSSVDNLFGADDPYSENRDAQRRDSATVEMDGLQVVTLVVKSEVGSVKVMPGDAGEVVVDYKLTAYAHTGAEAQAELAEMSVTVRANGDRVLVDASQSVDEGDRRSDTVDLTIRVPETTNLNITNNVGDVTVEGLSVPETLRLSQDVGSVSLKDVDVAAPVDAHVSVGDLRFNGSLAADQAHRFTTDTGSITLSLPAEASAMLDAEATVGSVDVDFTLTDRTDAAPGVMGSVHGTLGEGGEALTLRTSVGDIAVKQQ
ncbi:DUF4097 family beta strand repeat-containing protein [Aggregatilinea lenta]|uniref:DUF4097 family beta strand repeat-containing protein n=1 Tax=Aggregatilinea lenta TaxID=913108 RepID=UPI0013C37413|nr:DUF4097 family beta strand repeat-containing protein [Aggregatilinea lenta]